MWAADVLVCPWYQLGGVRITKKTGNTRYFITLSFFGTPPNGWVYSRSCTNRQIGNRMDSAHGLGGPDVRPGLSLAGYWFRAARTKVRGITPQRHTSTTLSMTHVETTGVSTYEESEKMDARLRGHDRAGAFWAVSGRLPPTQASLFFALRAA